MFGQKEDDTPGQNNGGAQDTGQPAEDSVDQILNAQPQTVAPTDAAGPAAEPAWQHPGAPISDPGTAPEIDQPSGAPVNENRDVFSPAGGVPSAPSSRITSSGPVLSFDTPAEDTPAVDTPADDLVAATPTAAAKDADLIEIKQKAIEELEPLIDKLDLSPEDKFKTIMMMIQATDDEALVEKAYEAAHSIEDEKVRAKALLDIVNEINYFTQPENNGSPA